MELQEIAALCAIIGFAFKAIQQIWAIVSKPIKKILKFINTKLVDFLNWVNKRFLS